jgi:hypothetical protein
MKRNYIVCILVSAVFLSCRQLFLSLRLKADELGNCETLLSNKIRQNNQENVANLLRLENSKRKVEHEKLELFRKRAVFVENKCKAISDDVLNTYEKYYSFWNYEEPNDMYEERFRRSLDRSPDDAIFPPTDTSTTQRDVRRIVYHSSFKEHGPTAVIPAFNILISVPEKCGSEFWFKIAEYLNFPQLSWPKNNFDKKKQQRLYLLPMLKDIEGAAESVHNHGTTIAVVRHPFLRLYSAYNGFFTANAILRDRKFAKFWLENSEAFHVLMNQRENVMKNFELVQIETEAKIDIMSFEEFIEGIVIHAEQNDETRSNLRWSEQGEAHINPIFSILMPCQYTYKYYLKLENMSTESRKLFDGMGVDLPSEYLIPFHQSENDDKLQEKMRRVYKNVPSTHLEKLAKFYELDLEFFQYSINIDTLEIQF